jgi:hypothetical protein
MPTHAARRCAIGILTSLTLANQPANAGREEWPKVQINDPVTRDAARRALSAASKWLSNPKCEPLFSEFQDANGIPLRERLRQMETTPEGYLQLVFFFDGAQHPTCQRHGILAFTAVGSRTVYLCGRDFERAWKRNPQEVQATIVHELLHSLGLGENPPSPRQITDRVQRLCWD